MRRLAVGLILLLAVACAAESGTPGTGTDKNACPSIRHAIERDKLAVQEASDPTAADKARADVDADARAARSLSGCDISDLVGNNVGR